MSFISRRDFIRASGAVSAGLFGFPIGVKSKGPKLSFSTLGCPDWNFQQIVQFASKNKYRGIELRGILRELNLPNCPEFNSPTAINGTLRLMKDYDLVFVNLGSSTQLHDDEGVDRQKHIDNGKKFIDLAHTLACPYIRVFPNNLPPTRDKANSLALISNGLNELGNYAKGSGVKVLLETHGDLVRIADIKAVMQSVSAGNVGLIWDVSNMWTVTQEKVADVYNELHQYFFHAHIKDANLIDGKPQYTLLGKGQVPIFEAIDLLIRGEYQGYYSFEWEKLWHPELAAPEIAIADYAQAMFNHFKH